MKIGYKLVAEAFDPQELIRQAVRAEEAGFDFVEISDHYHPWLDVQGHSPFAWTVLGAIAAKTERDRAGHRRDLPDRALPPGDHRAGRGHAGAGLRRPVHARRRLGGAAQRARGRARASRSVRVRHEHAARGAGDHPAAVAGRLPVLRGQAPAARGRPGVRPAGGAPADRGGRGRAATRPRWPPSWATACSPPSRKPDLVRELPRAGGAGPRYAEVPMAWAPDEDRPSRRRCEKTPLGADRLEGDERAAQPGQLRRRARHRRARRTCSGQFAVRPGRRAATSRSCSSSPTPGSTTSSLHERRPRPRRLHRLLPEHAGAAAAGPHRRPVTPPRPSAAAATPAERHQQQHREQHEGDAEGAVPRRRAGRGRRHRVAQPDQQRPHRDAQTRRPAPAAWTSRVFAGSSGRRRRRRTRRCCRRRTRSTGRPRCSTSSAEQQRQRRRRLRGHAEQADRRRGDRASSTGRMPKRRMSGVVTGLMPTLPANSAITTPRPGPRSSRTRAGRTAAAGTGSR